MSLNLTLANFHKFLVVHECICFLWAVWIVIWPLVFPDLCEPLWLAYYFYITQHLLFMIESISSCVEVRQPPLPIVEAPHFSPPLLVLTPPPSYASPVHTVHLTDPARY